MLKRIMLYFVLTTFLISVLMVTGIYVINERGLGIFEEQEVEDKSEVVGMYFEQTFDNIMVLNKAHAFWTDANNALSTEDDDWITRNLTEYLIEGEFQTDMMYLTNEDTSYVQSFGVDAQVIETTNLYNLVLHNDEAAHSFLWIDDTLYMLSGYPLANDDETNKNGALIIGREFDAQMYIYLLAIMGDTHENHFAIASEEVDIDHKEDEESVFYLAYTSIDDDVVISVHFVMSYTTYVREVMVNHLFLVVFVNYVLLFFVVGFLIRMFRKEFSQLQQQVEQIDIENNRNIEIRYGKAPELNKIIDAFNLLTTRVSKDYHDLIERNIEIATLLSKANEIYDPYTSKHSDSVSLLCRQIGELYGVKNIEELVLSANLHDIGKVFVSTDILNKKGALTKEEYEEIKTHPSKGYDLIKGLSDFKDISTGVLDHHERFDGSGYPNHKKAYEISLFGRIIAIADMYDALISTRSYRSAYTKKEALIIMDECKDAYFDPALYALFLSIVTDES